MRHFPRTCNRCGWQKITHAYKFRYKVFVISLAYMYIAQPTRSYLTILQKTVQPSHHEQTQYNSEENSLHSIRTSYTTDNIFTFINIIIWHQSESVCVCSYVRRRQGRQSQQNTHFLSMHRMNGRNIRKQLEPSCGRESAILPQSHSTIPCILATEIYPYPYIDYRIKFHQKRLANIMITESCAHKPLLRLSHSIDIRPHE